MRILVSNDDGIGAPGLRTLVDAARTLAPDIWVVAPERKWTAASHQLSFDRVLTLTRVAESEYACSGAPADCVVAAMTLLFAEGRKPDLVLAGVNDKLNVAEDLAYSGTMAIAREATFWDVPAIGISRSTRDRRTRGARCAAPPSAGVMERAQRLGCRWPLAQHQSAHRASGADRAGARRPRQDRRRERRP